MTLNKGLGFLFASGLLITACSTWNSGNGKRGIASIETWSNTPAKSLSSGKIKDHASSDVLPLKNAKLIVDNNRSFKSKLDILRNAKREVRMVYYIWSDDFTSSYFNSEVIAAARRGVKVKILVDFITNYDRLDLFTYLQDAGNGNIEVRFYGLPTAAIQKGAVFQTLPCSKKAVKSADQCQSEKLALMNQLGNPQTTWFSKIYLTGLYGKNAGLLQAAVGLGGQFDPKSLQSGEASPEQKAQLKEFAKIVFKAQIQGDVASKIKMGIALSTYGETLNPIMNELTGRLPLGLGNSQDWDHLTDYTHHKLIVADGNAFQLGGRNIEDSYHTEGLKKQIPESTGKYTFLDTDFYVESQEADDVEDAYDRLFDFEPMVGDLKKVNKLTPNEYDVNANAFKMSLGACLQEGKATPGDLESCVNSKISGMPGYQSLQARMAAVQKNMADKTQKLAKAYKPSSDRRWKESGDQLDNNDLASAETFYIENLSFNKSSPHTRIFGSKIGFEEQNGKSIHALWTKGLENACAISTKSGQKTRVVLHTAYLFFSSNLTAALGNMINGKWNCRNVEVLLITNSFFTTDLNVINIFARYQVNALLGYSQFIESNKASYVTAGQNKAKMKYYEYEESKEGTGLSLHTKLSVLGDDMIVGSANADVRSYFMDTNNGLYIRNAKGMIKDYNQYIDQLIAQKKITDRTMEFTRATQADFAKQNVQILNGLIAKWDKKGKLTPKRQQAILSYVGKMGASIHQATHAIVTSQDTLKQDWQNDNSSGNSKLIQSLDDLANSFDNSWKLL